VVFSKVYTASTEIVLSSTATGKPIFIYAAVGSVVLSGEAVYFYGW
jgi:hypothetical protein